MKQTCRRHSDKNAKYRVLVAGSIHLDILATSTSFSQTTDCPGELSIEIGGTAYNIASNFAIHTDVEVSFLTAMQDSELSKVILSSLERHSITSHVVFDKNLPQSGFSAHLNDGNLVSAISAIALEQAHISRVSWVPELIMSQDLVIIDCNFSPADIYALSSYCELQGVPYVLSAVSQSKALRIPYANSPSLISLNIEEATFLELNSSGRSWFQKQPKIITRAEHGLGYYHKDRQLTTEAVFVPKSQIISCLGAGDAACCGFSYAYFLKKTTLQQALDYSKLLASKVIQLPNCNLYVSDLLNSHLSELAASSQRDLLTGLYTREVGYTVLTAAYERFHVFKEPFCVLFIDLDHFKQINDLYGHAAGDLVLKTVAELFQTSLRASTDTPIRWGGEEFVLIFQQTSRVTAEALAERLRYAVSRLSFAEYSFTVTFSAGLLEYTSGSIEEFLHEVDQLMYVAKTTGRNQISLEQPSKVAH